MKYLLLLYDDAAAVASLSPAERRALVDEHMAYAAMLRERGVHVYADPLDDPATTRTVRFGADGAPLVSDGPFLETKEALGGFYVIDCASADEGSSWPAWCRAHRASWPSCGRSPTCSSRAATSVR